MNIFALWGEIEINRKKAETDIVAVEKQAEKSGKKMESSFDKVTKVVATAIKEVDKFGDRVETLGKNISKKAGVPLAALTALMGGLAKTTADYTATVKDNAAIVGLSAKSYQELQYAMQQSGLSQDEYLRMMGRVNQRIGFARQGNEKYRKSVEKLGISLADVDAGLVDTEDTFLAMIQYLHEMDDAQQQAAVAGDFFGVMLSRRMMPLIKDGAQSVEELRQRAHELGLVMDDLAIAKGKMLSDTLDDMAFTAKGLGRIFGSEMHAPMINISKAITDVIARFSTWLTENPKVVRQIIVWGGAIAGVLGVLVTLGTTMIVTGKIIGALGAIFNILTSKPILIIAAIGALYLAWESDWLGIRTAVENAWAKIEPVIDAIIEWGHQTISTVWNWTTKTVSAFLSWVQETAWPWIAGTVSTAWDWTTGKVGEFIAWIKETAWPWIAGTVSTAWDWTTGKVGELIAWIKETAWPWINDTVKTTWEWTVKGLDWLRELLGISGIDMGLTPEEEYAENLQYAIAEVMKHPEELWGEYTAMYARIWDVDENEIRKALGLPLIEQTIDAIDEAIEGAATLQDLLDAIYRAEGGAKAEVLYGMTGFKNGVQYNDPRDQARFEELAAGLEVGSEPYWRAAAQTTVEHYWRWFKTRFPELGEKTFDEVGPEIQSMFIAYLGSHFSPPEAHELNRNWVPNVLALVGFDELAQEFRAGNERVMDAWINAIYGKAGDVEAAVEWITGIVARYMVGTSPPPEGPLSDIDEGGAAIMEAWVEGAEDGLKDGVPKLTGALENIKNLFGTIWSKVPEEIRGPIEQAMTWMTDLIGQAEEALFKLDDFQAELDALMGGGKKPEEEAKGFMERLAKALDEKLEALDDPLNRFVDMVSSAALHLGEVVKVVKSGDWVGAILSIIMETESFALAMEILGKVLQPVIAVFDAVLLPIVRFIGELWNAIMRGLSSISIFGWRPFRGLEKHIIDLDGDKGGGSGSDRSSGGRQISEITGPTRDLLVDLLSPLANFGQIVAPIQDIRDILDQRLPNFNAFGMEFAAAGAGAMSPAVVIENLNVTAPTTGVDDISRASIDQIEKALAGRIAIGQRGRGKRW